LSHDQLNKEIPFVKNLGDTKLDNKKRGKPGLPANNNFLIFKRSPDQIVSIPGDRWKYIIPPAILVYIVAFIDRTNIGFAIAGGMDKTLGMTTTVTGLVAGIFFIGYLFLQIPGGRIAERGSAKKFVAWTILAWGCLTILSGFAQNVTQILILRFLIGFAEGGVWPAILTIISHWFPREERARANALFMMNAPIASIIAGPLSGWILATYSWRHLFIIEGLLALLLMIIWVPLISDYPRDAKWISGKEKDYIESKLHKEQEELNPNNISKVKLVKVFSKVDLWKLMVIYFFYQTGIYGFVLWFPTLLKSLTHSGIFAVGMLSTIPYIATIIGLYYFAKLSDRKMNRKLYTALPMIGFALCLVLSVQFKSTIWISFAFLVLCGFFLLSANGVFWTIPTMLFPGDMAATSLGIINIAGGVGGFLGPYMLGFLTSRYSTDAGIYSLVLILMSGFLITLILPAKTGNFGKMTYRTISS
jgi:MFS family permease